MSDAMKSYRNLPEYGFVYEFVNSKDTYDCSHTECRGPQPLDKVVHPELQSSTSCTTVITVSLYAGACSLRIGYDGGECIVWSK